MNVVRGGIAAHRHCAVECRHWRIGGCHGMNNAVVRRITPHGSAHKHISVRSNGTSKSESLPVFNDYVRVRLSLVAFGSPSGLVLVLAENT